MESTLLHQSLRTFRDLPGFAAGEKCKDLRNRQLQYLDNAELFEILNAEYKAYKLFHESVMQRLQTSAAQ